MRGNFKVTESEKKNILESHLNLKKVLFEHKNIMVLTEDDNTDKALLQKAVEKKCKQADGAQIVKTNKGNGPYALKKTATTASAQGNYGVGDIILYYATPGQNPNKYKAKSKNTTTNKVTEFEWSCKKLQELEGEALYQAQTTINSQEWVSEDDPDLKTKIDFTNYEKMTSGGKTYYKNKYSTQVAAVSDDQKQFETIANQSFGAKGTGWDYKSPINQGWQEFQFPGSSKYFGNKGDKVIYVEPGAYSKYQSTTGANQRQLYQQKFELSNDDCKGVIDEFFEAMQTYGYNTETSYFQGLKDKIKSCRTKFCGDGRYCESGNRLGGLGNKYDKMMDLFTGSASISGRGGKMIAPKPAGSPFRID